MKKNYRIIIPILFGLLVVNSCICIRLVRNVENYAKLINYVGIVRGASQREVKLETNGHPDDGLIGYIDDILNELVTGEGNYGLVKVNNRGYQDKLMRLYDQWGAVKSDIRLIRKDKESVDIIESSEILFGLANDTVFSIEALSRRQSSQAGVLVIITGAACALSFAVIIWYYITGFIRLKKANEELQEEAGHDDLTGAYNAEMFQKLADVRIREKKDKKFAVLYIDFENFKYINDVFGYDYGDKILKGYAAFMMEQLRADELFGRESADQFTAFLWYEDKAELLARQQRMDNRFLNSELVLSSRHMMITACGICCLEDIKEERSAGILVDKAEFAQKLIKHDPGSHYAFYDEEVRRRRFMEISIRDKMKEALDEGEFVVYMQPKVGVKDKNVKGAEALVRWCVPEQEMISPGVFIPVLEKYHFIGNLDRYMFKAVCMWMHKRIEDGLHIVPISVNVSRIQFYDSGFVDTYADIKREYEVPDWMLEIEFTESVAFGNQDYIQNIVMGLHRNGFLCSIDDFGSGYSSLGLLKDLAVDGLKLDGSFFKVSVNVEREQTIVESIIRMVKALNICTVAEGVEREEQVEFLQDVGCDLIQGFVYYKPMPLEDFEEVLEGDAAALDQAVNQ